MIPTTTTVMMIKTATTITTIAIITPTLKLLLSSDVLDVAIGELKDVVVVLAIVVILKWVLVATGIMLVIPDVMVVLIGVVPEVPL